MTWTARVNALNTKVLATFGESVTLTQGATSTSLTAVIRKAADIRIDGISPQEIAGFANTLMPSAGGIKAYPNFCHVDVRTGWWRG